MIEPLARIYGEPLAQLPLDLYIPPDALAIMLEAFEGPLDLLLYLIRKANVNVLDIPMAPLTKQYLSYVDAMRARNLELAADYLVMAAVLIEIKSRMLLPRAQASEEEDEDPRAELMRRLIEYEQIKQAAQRLNALAQAERDFFWLGLGADNTRPARLPTLCLDDLSHAWTTLLRQYQLSNQQRAHHRIEREELSVREHMGLILRYLRKAEADVEFATLCAPSLGLSTRIVYFLALLELAREQLIEITQDQAFSPLYLSLPDARIKPCAD
ncbi:MAG: ScpA family protein [Pseudomonadota bacterium]